MLMPGLVYIRAIWRRLFWALRWAVGIAFLLLILRHATPPYGAPYYALATQVKDAHFDYISWEIGAIGAKLGQAASRSHAHLPEAERAAFVRAYFDDLARARQLEAEIERSYTDPTITDPDTSTAEQRRTRDELRASLQARQTMTEAILEEQVSTVLVDEGFGIGGQLVPPVSMRFIQQTQLLVASPRDEIDMAHAMTVEPLPVDVRERIEAEILAEENLSVVIVPIGGMALYPAMIVESTSLAYTVETFAHEWLHHYLMGFPIGYETELFQNPESRIINETTASIFGREMGRKVLLRYYPDLVPPEAPPPNSNAAPPTEPAPPAFDFGAEMHQTRTTVDELLAAGNIAEAEAYMEERRQLFVTNGYGIRKLNQAWFAFYGGYQVEGINAGGEDPIGPAVQQLREAAPDARTWVHTMRTITTREALLAVRDAL